MECYQVGAVRDVVGGGAWTIVALDGSVGNSSCGGAGLFLLVGDTNLPGDRAWLALPDGNGRDWRNYWMIRRRPVGRLVGPDFSL